MQWSKVSLKPLGDLPDYYSYLQKKSASSLNCTGGRQQNAVGIGWLVGQRVNFVEYVSVLHIIIPNVDIKSSVGELDLFKCKK